jgi:hypothetical protein
MQVLHPTDITVVVLYLVGITALGIWMARRVKQVSDFFMPIILKCLDPTRTTRFQSRLYSTRGQPKQQEKVKSSGERDG